MHGDGIVLIIVTIQVSLYGMGIAAGIACRVYARDTQRRVETIVASLELHDVLGVVNEVLRCHQLLGREHGAVTLHCSYERGIPRGVIGFLRQTSHIAGTVEVGLHQLRTQAKGELRCCCLEPYQVFLCAITVVVGPFGIEVILCPRIVGHRMKAEVAKGVTL